VGGGNTNDVIAVIMLLESRQQILQYALPMNPHPAHALAFEPISSNKDCTSS
jgi:hypothetical protein